MPDVVVQYGKPGFVGRFRAAAEYPRGCDVVVRTPRGLERGVVLHAGHLAKAVNPLPDGDVEREATAADAVDEDLAAAVLRHAEATAAPASWLDAEATLDGTFILHVLAWGESDLTPFVESVSAAVGRPVKLFNVGSAAVATDPPTTCGKPDCGTGAGKCDSCGTGCSTGSCSRKAVKNADELTAYFADLRKQMETRTSLV